MARKNLRIGVDLGTSNILVYINGHGIVFNEPSVLAFDRNTNECIAIGKQAQLMQGKEHSQIRIVRPMLGGVIADLAATRTFLEFVFTRLETINVDLKTATLLICCPSAISGIEREALLDLAYSLGVKDAFVEQELKAGAIGAGIDLYSAKGALLLDIGGGSTDVGVLSLGDIVVSDSVKVAGDHIDREIAKYVKYKYNMLIGNMTAEKIKIQLGTLKKEIEEDEEGVFAGRNITNGLPQRFTIRKSEIRDILVREFQAIVNAVMKILQVTPPEIAADIYSEGLTINGGGALIEGVKEYFEEALNLKVKLAPNPLTSIVEGTKVLLINRGNYLVKPSDY